MQPSNPFRNNPLLNAGARGKDSPRRLPWAVSILFHVLFVIGLLVLPERFARPEAQPERIDIVFYKPEIQRPAPPPPVVPEPEPETEPPAPLPEPVIVAEARPEPAPSPAPVVRTDPPPPARPKPPPEPVVAQVMTKPRPPKSPTPRPKPKPKTGTFSQPTTEPVPAVRPERAVALVGSFGSEPIEAPVHQEAARKSRVVAAGSFGGGAVEVPREPAEPRPQVVTQNSFATVASEPPAPKKKERSVVATAAFNGAPAAGRLQPASRTRSVSHGGFGAVENRAASPDKRSLPVEDLDSPVEIVSKPKPAYTEAARGLRIEGEVVLEVTFGNSGELRVLRVVDGLGHGLDEAAIAAAKKIQFTPARRDGRPVDHTATLRVVFRLA